MRKLSENIHPVIRVLIVTPILALSCATSFCTIFLTIKHFFPKFSTITATTHDNVIYTINALFYTTIIGAGTFILVPIVTSIAIEFILGKKLFSVSELFASQYAISNRYVIAHAFNQINRDKAIIHTRLRLSFSYQEIEAFHNLMRRKVSVYHALERYDIPYPVTSFTPAISRHTTRHLLKTMHPNQYVVFEYDLKCDYTGIDVPDTQQFITQRDVFKLQTLISSSNQRTISASIGNKQGITIDIRRLEEFKQLLPEKTNDTKVTCIDLNQAG